MSHHIERCACGSVLKHVAEREAGMCVSCMIAEDHLFDRICVHCGALVADPSEFVAGSCPRCLAELSRQYNAALAQIQDEQDTGLMRDSMRVEGRACDIPATWRR